MPDPQRQSILELPAGLPGDAGDLLSAVGAAETLTGMASVLTAVKRHRSGVPALREFLTTYVNEVLLPVEIPTVLSAWEAAEESHLLDLLNLDQSLADNPQLRDFRAASTAVGRRQLNRLRPLRDQRFVQRYRRSMERGEAAAWHTIVYGVVLSLYSLPLRDGLQHLATQTMAGFATMAAPEFGLRPAACRACLQDVTAALPDHVNAVLAKSAIGSPNLFTSSGSEAAL